MSDVETTSAEHETAGAVSAQPGRQRRSYNRWASNAMLQDYSLRYAPHSFRTWSPYVVAGELFRFNQMIEP